MNKVKLSVAALVAAALLALTGASSASAADAVVLNGNGVNGGAATSAFFTIGRVAVVCTNTGSSVDLASATAAYPIAIGRNLTLTFTRCSLAGVAATVVCTATGEVDITAGSVLDDTPVSWSSLACDVSLVGRFCTTISGNVAGRFSNTTQKTTLSTAATLGTGASACPPVPANTATSLAGNAAATVALVYQAPVTLRMLAS